MAGPIQEAKIFKKRSAFSRTLGAVVKTVFEAFTKNTEYIQQAPDAIRNLEMTVEYGLKLAVSEPRKCNMVAQALIDWQASYFGAHKATKDKIQYLIYTEEDHKIPFRPQEDILYAYLPAQIAYTAYNLTKVASEKELTKIINIVKDLNQNAAQSFNDYPAKMPRFTNHNRLTLKVVQAVDPQQNSCPSLHMAYSALLYNLVKNVFRLQKKDADGWDALEYTAHNMANTILYTKQHCLADVSFGILAAEQSYKKWFPKNKFDNLMDVFCGLKEEHDHIPYGTIEKIYNEAKQKAQNTAITKLIAEYYDENDFPTIPPSMPNCYFDRKEKKIMLLDENGEVLD